MDSLKLYKIGYIESPLTELADKNPKMEFLPDAPQAVIHIDPQYIDGLSGLRAGSSIVVLTWLHLADRTLLVGHPRGDRTREARGVFSMRSPCRPNPIGIHTVKIRKIEECRIYIDGIEAINSTPVIDIKNVSSQVC